MKPKFFLPFLFLASASSVFAQTPPAFSFCGTYGAYVMLYKNTDQFEELGKLRCGEKVDVLGRWFDYLQIRTLDGKIGWVRSADISGGPAVFPSPTPFGLTSSTVPAQHEAPVPLSNKNIISMHATRLSPDVIIAKIKSSPTRFDTSADGLQKLKRAGISDDVILAMVQASADASTAAPMADPPKPPEILQIRVPDGTPVEVEMIASVSSDAVREGTIIHLKVAREVVIDGVTVFPRDSEARARVYVITQPAFMGKPGQISWAMDNITAINGDHLPATFAPKEPSTGSLAANVEDTGTTWEFRKNKASTIAAGHRIRVTIHGDITLKIPADLAAQSPAGADVASPAQGPVQASHEPPQAGPANGSGKP
jgi:SH3 domain-containing protein